MTHPSSQTTVATSPLRGTRRGLPQRVVFLLVGDILCIALAAALSDLLVRGTSLENGEELLGFVVALALVGKVPVFYLCGMYSLGWRHVGLHDMLLAARTAALGSVLLTLLVFVFGRLLTLPPLYVLIPVDFMATLCLVGGFRISGRVYAELRNGRHSAHPKRVLVYGAGSAGEQLVRAMQSDVQHTYQPVGFIDDDVSKVGTTIHGVKVLGTGNDLGRISSAYRVDELLIAIPSADGPVIRDIVRQARGAGIKVMRSVPPLAQLFSRRLGLSELRDLQPEDLLRRKQVTINPSEVKGAIKGSTVLVTGAGGSIGSELCRQLLQFEPAKLLALDREETALFEIGRQLMGQHGGVDIGLLLADICDSAKIERIFAQHKPQIVFHAAAYKHVPLMEENPSDAIRNNVVGTRIVAEASLKHGVDRFVLISTDKAVNPTSVMGASKRLAENLVRELNSHDKTKFVSVRFGNVLGSRGSVIPIFKEQLLSGGPITVTHPEMSRYFMTTKEAVLLVIQAAVMGQGGEVFVLDMGEPVNILELARDVIRLAGYEPDVDIPIVFTGIRPGEKLFEDLLTAEEGTLTTRHDKIFVAKPGIPANGSDSLLSKIGHLETLADAGDNMAIIDSLRGLIPNYTSGGSTPAKAAERWSGDYSKHSNGESKSAQGSKNAPASL